MCSGVPEKIRNISMTWIPPTMCCAFLLLCQLDTTLTTLNINHTNVTENLVFLQGLSVQLSEMIVVFGQLGHEFISGFDGLQSFRHNVLDRECRQIQLEASQSTADSDLLA